VNVVKELAKIDRIYALDGRLPAFKASLAVTILHLQVDSFLNIITVGWDFLPYSLAILWLYSATGDVVSLKYVGALMSLVGLRMLFWYDVYRGYTFVDAEIEEGDTELAQGLAYYDDLHTDCTDYIAYVTARAVDMPGYERS